MRLFGKVESSRSGRLGILAAITDKLSAVSYDQGIQSRECGATWHRAAFTRQGPAGRRRYSSVRLEQKAQSQNKYNRFYLQTKATRSGHFMPPELLNSQYADLEPLGDDEAGVTLDVSLPARTLAGQAAAALGLG